MADELVGADKGAIDVSALADRLETSVEVARLWVQNQGPGTFIINAYRMPDARMFGMMITDTVRHASRAYAQALGISEAQAAASIWHGVDAERENHTTELETLEKGERLQ
jgi:Domain of unknown function (DUF5076)